MSSSHTRWELTALPVLYSGTMNGPGLTWPKLTLALSELGDSIPWRWTLLASAVRPAWQVVRGVVLCHYAAGWGQFKRPFTVPLATQGAPAAVPSTGAQNRWNQGHSGPVPQ